MPAPSNSVKSSLSKVNVSLGESETGADESHDQAGSAKDLFQELLGDAAEAIDYQMPISSSIRPYSELCHNCERVIEALSRGISDSNWQRYVNVDHVKGGLTALQQSASNRCALCVQFLGSDPSIAKTPIPPNPQARGVVMVCPEFKDEGPVHPVLCFCFEGKGLNLLESQYLSRVAVLPTQNINLGTTKSWDTPQAPLLTTEQPASTRDSIPLLLEWLRRCCESHPLCNQFIAPAAPSRLIYIGENQIRLQVDTREIKSYASLSHCWGKTHFQLLTCESLKLFQSQIPSEALSKTFQDAISLVRALHINYIWIDSLCIIQDSAEDWKEEAAKMAGVYGGATINIAASASPDGNGGLFFDRPNNWRCKTQFGDDGKGYECLDQSLYYRSVSSAILSSRGWCMQERLLPRRTIFFARDQVFWECHQREACESFPTETPDELMHFVPPKRVVQRSSWEDIIKAYSDTKLTKGSDKLVAISGVARAIQLQTGDDFIAGFWRTGLIAQLCWRVCYGDEGDGTSPYRAPSWSWAALDTEVEFELRVNDAIIEVAEVLSVSKTSSGEDVLQIASDFLIHGDLVALRSAFRTGSEWKIIFRDVEQRLDHYKSSVSMDQYLNTEESLSDDEFEDEWDEDEDGDPKEDEENHIEKQGERLADLWFLQLCIHEKRDKTLGLVLQSTGQVKGQYRRVGMFMWSLQDFGAVESTFEMAECQAQEHDRLSTSVSAVGKKRTVVEIL